MNYYDPTDEEQKIIDDVDNGQFERIGDFETRKQDLQTYAKHTLNKAKNINIRLSERDLHLLKAKAAEEGLPYQTLVSSILHKAVTR